MSPAMIAIRKSFPSLRRERPTAIIHNGGKRTVYGCICGSTHSCATDWRGRDSVHVAVWRAEHDSCAEDLKNATAMKVGSWSHNIQLVKM